ncbi:MAG TPA: calcium-binding EGF-like domain-containing protein, partial [Bacteroidia bacterium]|nr:calcium-binding EGF-like domain-containing protein [Bacteroidia bacterium]
NLKSNNMKTKLLLTLSVILLSFSTCKKDSKDPCENIHCLNGGSCANGICNCPPGYTGSDCGTLMTPSSVTVSKIILNSYPVLGYDFSNGPDVFLSINPGAGASDVQFTGITTDATGSAITFTNNFPYTFSSPSTNYTIGVWDYDTPDPDDIMDAVYFTPNNYSGGFPSTFTVTGSSISMTLYVSWHF